MADSHQRAEAAIKAFAKGEVVVVTDDDERENEGDLFVAAAHCTTEKMAFIIRNTSGIVCVPLGAEQARRLHLEPMVADNEAPLGTAFSYQGRLLASGAPAQGRYDLTFAATQATTDTLASIFE